MGTLWGDGAVSSQGFAHLSRLGHTQPTLPGVPALLLQRATAMLNRARTHNFSSTDLSCHLRTPQHPFPSPKLGSISWEDSMGLSKAIADLLTVTSGCQRERAEAGHRYSWVPALPRADQGLKPSQALQVVLGVGPEALINAALQMDGQVGNAEDGPLHMYQALLQAPRGWVLKHKEDSWGQACRAERLQ